ncbi:MAG: Zn-dependent oligopeptidase [Gammaproteobacteria bacterium]|nr:Zn-dependent oligopeptidase [Gammaproteobacteria bacterium]
MTRTKSHNKLLHRFPAFITGLFLTAILSACGQSDNTDNQQSEVEAKTSQPATESTAKFQANKAGEGTEKLLALSSFQPAAKRAKVLFELPVWEKTPTEIDTSVSAAIEKGDKQLDAIATLSAEESNFANTIAALDDAFYQGLNVNDRIDVIRETSQKKAMRDKALEASKKIQAWYVAAGFREDVYKTVVAYAATRPRLRGEDAMLLKETLRDYRRNGMALPKEKRQQLKELKTELNNMSLEFAANITEAKVAVEFTAEELAGMPEDFLNNKELKTDKGTYKVKANVNWQYIAVMQNASNEETRKKLVTVRSNRAKKKNIPLFTKILKTRAQIATLLGYDNWADYRIETKMAKTAKTAFDFEQRLVQGLQPKFDDEMVLLQKLKADETGNPDAKIMLWDMRYYKNILKKTRYQVDTSKLKVFFELDNVLNGMFGIFEEIFGLKIEAVEPGYKWVDDLRLYAIIDSASGDPLGLIYMDLYPREDKYGHFAQFGVTTGKLLNDGFYQRPVVALIVNFPPATEDRPSLLKHSDVETLFHEFGHALHSVLTQAKYASFSGTSVPRDFVEAPSQMLENWVWDKSVLDRFAVDYRDPSKKIPEDTLDRMEQARFATIATWYRRQLSFGMLDLKLHMSSDEKDFDNFVKVSNDIMSKVYLAPPKDTAFVASFGHLAGGYDAGYYGYAWAEAISADMVSVFKKSPGGLMDKDVGKRLRDEIYAKGGSREIDESINAFLGRKRSLDPFFEYIGLGDKK